MLDMIGGTLIDTAANFGVQAGLAGINQLNAYNFAAKDREENYRYNEMAANAADTRTRGLYRDLYSPSAQMQQLKEAGLSPSLYYKAGTGVAGTSGAMGHGNAGLQTPVAQIGMQLDTAQIMKTLAETKLINQQAKTEAGENQKGQAQIAQILAEAGYKESAQYMNRVNSIGIEIENDIKKATQTYEITRLISKSEEQLHMTEQAYTDLKQKQVDLSIADRSKDARVEEYIAQAQLRQQEIVNAITQKQLNEAQTNMVNQKIEQIFMENFINVSYLELKEQEQNAQIAKIGAEIEKMYKELGISQEMLEQRKTQMWLEFSSKTLQSLVNVAELAGTRGFSGMLKNMNNKTGGAN